MAAPVLQPITLPSPVPRLPNASAQNIAPLPGALLVSDADAGNTLTVAQITRPALSWSGGTLSGAQLVALTAALGTGKLALGAPIKATGGQQVMPYTWDPSAADLSFLAPGQTLTVSYSLRVSDGTSNSAAQTLRFTISAENHAPVLAPLALQPATVAEQPNAAAQDLAPITGSFNASDADIGNTLVATAGPVQVLRDGQGFSLPAGAASLVAPGVLTLGAGTSNGGSVAISYTYNPAGADLDFLAAGQQLSLVWPVWVNDGTTSSGSQYLVITISGSNDAAVLGHADVGLDETDAALTAQGSLSISDVDSQPAFVPQTDTVGAHGRLSIDAAGHWQFVAGSAFDALNVGQSVSDSFSVAAVDGTTTQVQVTLRGTNDAPQLPPVAALQGQTGSLLSFDAHADDPDTPAASITYSLVGVIPEGVVFDPHSGHFSWTPAEDQAGVSSFELVASDNGSPDLSDRTAVSITVSGPPLLSIDDVVLFEGASSTQAAAVFTVSMSQPAGPEGVDVSWSTLEGSAHSSAPDAGDAPDRSDFVAASGVLHFEPAQSLLTIPVTVLGDDFFEGTESFSLQLSSPTHALIADGLGQATILGDEALPLLSIDEGAVVEGHDGQSTMLLRLMLSEPVYAPEGVTVQYQVAGDTATDGLDFLGGTGSVSIPVGQQEQLIAVPVLGDTLLEGDERFTVSLLGAVNAAVDRGQASGVILDDDAPLTLSIADAQVMEGRGPSGGFFAQFAVTLDHPAVAPVSVDYSFTDGSATGVAWDGQFASLQQLFNEPGDYAARTTDRTLSFGPGQSQAFFQVPIRSDGTVEGPESFFISLSNASGASIADDQATITILDFVEPPPAPASTPWEDIVLTGISTDLAGPCALP